MRNWRGDTDPKIQINRSMKDRLFMVHEWPEPSNFIKPAFSPLLLKHCTAMKSQYRFKSGQRIKRANLWKMQEWGESEIPVQKCSLQHIRILLKINSWGRGRLCFSSTFMAPIKPLIHTHSHTNGGCRHARWCPHYWEPFRVKRLAQRDNKLERSGIWITNPLAIG